MSDFSVVLKNRAGTVELYQAQGFVLRPVRYSSKAIGGPEAATLRVDGVGDALWSVLNWLGYGVEIRNHLGVAVWWGRVWEADVQVNGLRRGCTMEKMYNKIAIAYSVQDVDGQAIYGETGWATDSESSNRYGNRELRYSLGDGEGVAATAKRDWLLSKLANPKAQRRNAAGEDGATLYCVGLWAALDDAYYQRLEGRIENNGGGSEIEIAFGWKLNTSTRVHFMGTSISYTRTISNARGIYTLAVSGATNATPIVVTTTVAHERKAGDIVTIAGVGGNTAANGTFKVKNVTDTTFALTDQSTGSNIAGNGNYTSGGTVTATSNPIVVTTTVAHAVRGGDIVTIAGVSGNTAANGTYKAKNVTSTTFELSDQSTGNDIAGNGAYSGGGSMTRVIEKNDAALMYGRKVTDATNATPIVVTCAGHGFVNGNIVKISDVQGNTAANGTFQIGSVTTNTFALSDPLTGLSVAGNGDYAIGGAAVLDGEIGPFETLKAGQILTVSGSASNNVAFTAVRNARDSGNAIDVSPVPTNEVAGATVTIAAHGEQVAQGFTATANFSASRIAIKLGKYGSPADNVTIELRSDSGGVPSSTILAYATLPASGIGATKSWRVVDLSTRVSLSLGATYWIVLKRSGSTSAFNYFITSIDSSLLYSGGGLLQNTPSGTWVTRTPDGDLPFRVLDATDTAEQLRAMLATVSLFAAVDGNVNSGITVNQWRDGMSRCLAEVVKLLEMRTSSGRRLLASVSPDRVASLFVEPVATEYGLTLRRGEFITAAGAPLPAGVLPVGAWANEVELPQNLDILVDGASLFVERAEYDCERRELQWWPRDDDDPLALPGVAQG